MESKPVALIVSRLSMAWTLGLLCPWNAGSSGDGVIEGHCCGRLNRSRESDFDFWRTLFRPSLRS